MSSISGIYSQNHLAICDIHHNAYGMRKRIKKLQRKQEKVQRKKDRNKREFTPVVVRRPKADLAFSETIN